MSAPGPLSRKLLWAVCAAAGLYLTSCANRGGVCNQSQKDYYCGPPGCFGHYSTCWRAWPEECVSCPPFTLGDSLSPLESEGANLPEEVAPPTDAVNPGGVKAEQPLPPESLPAPSSPPRKMPAEDDSSSNNADNPLRSPITRRPDIVRVGHDRD